MSNGKLGSKNSTESNSNIILESVSDEGDDDDKKSLGSFGEESNKT